MTSSLTLSPEDSSPEDSSGQGRRSDRVRPGAEPSVDREVLGVSERGVRRVELEIETEETVDPEVMREFIEKQNKANVERRQAVWRLLFDEVVMERLRNRDVDSWRRERRRRDMEVDASVGPLRMDTAAGESGVIEPDDESTEGMKVRVPTVPYVPTENERRVHNVTHYPHRTWCEVCMAGRTVAGAYRRSDEESDPSAGEFQFDCCFLKTKVAEDPAVTLIRVDKAPRTQSLLMWCQRRALALNGWLRSLSVMFVALDIMVGW